MSNEFAPVFIGGTGRSGTTILLNLLSRHPEFHASMPREIKYLTSRHGLVDITVGRPLAVEENFKAYRNNLIARALPLIGKSGISSFEAAFMGSWWSETGKKGNARGLVQGISQEFALEQLKIFTRDFKKNRLTSSRELFYSLSGAQISDSGIKYFGDSTPVNIMQADLITRILPESKFIQVIRDGRDVATSVVKEKWGPTEHFQALDWWKNRMVKGHAALNRIPAASHLTLRIEDLVIHRREETLERIKNFLDLPSHKRFDSYFEEEILPGKLHAGRWKTEPVDVSKFSSKYQAILKELNKSGIIVKEL